MRYVFFGGQESEFAQIFLDKLIEAGLPPVLSIRNARLDLDTEQLKSAKADFFLVAAFGKILPKNIIELPPKGTIGVHPSLLPKYRGASPIQSVLLAGEHATGVSLFMLDEKMDAGPVIAQKNVLIQLDETYETLSEKLANVGGELLLKIMPDLESAKTNAETQDEARATY